MTKKMIKTNKGQKKRTPRIYFHHKDYDPSHFINRDLSWLEFNSRVLNEACDPRTPLLERLKYCDIFRSNNDEFFQKRISRLVESIKENDGHVSLDGSTSIETLENIRQKVLEQVQVYAQNFDQKIVPELSKNGIKLLKWSDINPFDRRFLLNYYRKNIFPILTPLAVDAGHPFPFLSNLSKSVGIKMRRPREKVFQFARVKIPWEIPQWVQLKPSKDHPYRFINIEELIINNLDLLFSGMIIDSTTIFRVTRSANTLEERIVGDDLKEYVEEGLKERKFASIVRLQLEKNPDPWIVNYLREELDVMDLNIFEMPSIVGYSNLSSLYEINKPQLKFKRRTPKEYAPFEIGAEGEIDIFSAIRKKDHLVHFPYESFQGTVEQFLKISSLDPKVRAIKIVLYRTDADGRFIRHLINASENKKQVACLVELKARFDEEKNIHWAHVLEEHGIHVSYGLAKLKTHAKLIMVVRQDQDRLRTYSYIGTGNFNSNTSKLYTDYGLFTCKKIITDEVIELFNFLTGRSLRHNYNKLLVAPFSMHRRFIESISREIESHKKHKNGLIIAKMNSLEEPQIIELLYKASQAGVKIILIVRGFCCLKPGVKGLSQNIKVFSLVGRLLEHSRVFYFRNGAKDPVDGDFFIGSADWMYRNLFNRIEVIAPIDQRELKQILWNDLQMIQIDNRHLWEMDSKGHYVQRKPGVSKEINYQKELLGLARGEN
ncbi:MAG: polyphosphate kinase 1 [Bacteriovoracaceae bacterium]